MKDKKKDHKQNRLDHFFAALPDSQAFWQEIEKYKCKPTKSSFDGITCFSHCRTVFNDTTNTDDKDCEHHEIPDTAGDFKFDTLSGDITETDVRQALNSLKKCKAAGPDGIPNDLLKIALDNVIHYLAELFNQMFKSGSYTSEWAKAIIQPIRKKGDTANPHIYRGISLLSCISKFYTSVINLCLT